MAEADSTAKAAGSFLTRKVGPLPLGIWLVAAAGIYYYFSRKSSSASPGNATSPGSQTDPAGNVGYIDPSTGYVYGSPEDTAALQAASQNASTTSGSSTSSSVGSTYADNNAWGRAAINYLAGLGVDASTANQAIQLYLSSQPLTTAQQGDVNLAIQALGPPPDLPGPVTGNPPPVTTPPGGTGGTVTVPKVTGLSATAAVAELQKVGLKAGSEGKNGGSAIVNSQTPGPGIKVAVGSTVDLGLAKSGQIGGGNPPHVTAPVPTGLTVSNIRSTSATATWKRSSGATGYQVTVVDLSSQKTVQSDGTKTTTDVIGGLAPGHHYQVQVAAQPNSGAHAPHASANFTTASH